MGQLRGKGGGEEANPSTEDYSFNMCSERNRRDGGSQRTVPFFRMRQQPYLGSPPSLLSLLIESTPPTVPAERRGNWTTPGSQTQMTGPRGAPDLGGQPKL